MHYRKRPVVIEAWLASDLLYAAAKEWKLLPEPVKEAYEEGDVIFHDTYITIATLEGTHRAEKTDMVIRGVKGELYPCKPDIFEATYEAVAENIESGATSV